MIGRSKHPDHTGRGRAVWFLACCAVVSIAVSACTTAASPRTHPTRTASSEDVVVEFRQNRDQYATGAAVVRITNRGVADLAITDVEVGGPAFTATTSRDRRSTVPAGQIRDLAVVVPPVDCGAEDAAPTLDVVLLLDDGSSIAAADVADPTDALPRIRSAVCTGEAVGRIAEVTAEPAVRLEGSGATTVAVLTIRVEPTGTAGRLELVTLRSTVLLQPAPTADGASSSEDWPLGLVVDATGDPRSIELRVVPTRCDPHALAEDKVGTLFPLVVRIDDGPEAVMTLPLALDTADALKDAVRERCAGRP